MGQIIPVPVSRNVIKIIQVINPDTDNCNSWALRVLRKYDELVKKSKNEAVNFNNIRLFPSYNIYNFYFGVSSVIGFKCMV